MRRLWPCVPSLGPLAFMPSSMCLTFIAVTTGTFQSLLGLQQGASLLPHSHHLALLPGSVKEHRAGALIEEKDLEVPQEVEKRTHMCTLIMYACRRSCLGGNRPQFMSLGTTNMPLRPNGVLSLDKMMLAG